MDNNLFLFDGIPLHPLIIHLTVVSLPLAVVMVVLSLVTMQFSFAVPMVYFGYIKKMNKRKVIWGSVASASITALLLMGARYAAMNL